MILRLAANTSIHTAGGVIMGVTVVLAACTVAQVVQRGARCAMGMGNTADTMPPAPPPNPPAA
jgi:hypothetical protein